jgi:hypothetical protein
MRTDFRRTFYYLLKLIFDKKVTKCPPNTRRTSLTDKFVPVQKLGTDWFLITLNAKRGGSFSF